MSKILVIDDNITLLSSIKELLEGFGYEVTTAIDGFIGLTEVNIEKPDLIILDLLMPRMNGYQVCSILKSDRRFQDIPILILSGCLENALSEFSSEKNKPESFLPKPCDSNTLLTRVKELLEITATNKEALQKKLCDEDAKWIKHYPPDRNINKFVRKR